jgi:D-xylose transport system ATP-binding protein
VSEGLRQVLKQCPGDATRLGIDTVYQDLALCDNLDSVANLFLGRELIGPHPLGTLLRMLAEPAMQQRAAAQLADLRVTTISSVHSPVAMLSGGQRLGGGGRASDALGREAPDPERADRGAGVTQTATVLELIKQLRTQGLGVVVISHNIDVVFEVADRIVVLYVGRHMATFEQAATTRHEVIGAIVGLAGAAPQETGSRVSQL